MVVRTDTEMGRRGESWGCRYRAGWFGQISSEHLGKMNVCECGGQVGLRHGKATSVGKSWCGDEAEIPQK